MLRALKHISLFVMILSSQLLLAQNPEADSLMRLIKNDKLDTNKFNHSYLLAVKLWDNLDTAIICGKKALEIAESIDMGDSKKGWPLGIAKAHYLLGVFNFDKGNYPDALLLNKRALEIWEEIEKKSVEPELHQIKYSKAKSIGEIGNAYYGLNNYPKALEFQLRALKIYEELKVERGIGNTNGNIGNIYSDQKNFKKAEEYYLKSLKVGRKLGSKYDMSIDLRNLANTSKNMGKMSKSLEYSMMALVVSKEIGNQIEIANNMNSVGCAIETMADSAMKLGESYESLEPQYAKAKDYYLQSLQLDREQGNQNGESYNLQNLAGLLMHQHKFDLSEQYFLQALAIDSAMGSVKLISDIHEGLGDLYIKKGDYKKALQHYKLHAQAKDSLFSEEKSDEITRHEMNYEFEKKEADLKAEQDKKEAIALTDKKRQNIFFWLVSLIAIAVAIIAVIIFRSLRTTSKQKSIIEHQKNLVEEKQKEILDSIHYAKRIQESLLPNEKYIQKNLQRLNKKS